MHLHVKNSVRLHQAEVRLISFFLTPRQRKRKRTYFNESLLEGATHFMEKENDQDIINDIARVVEVLADKNRKLREPTQDQNVRTKQWTELYNQKSDGEFPEKMRINRTTFNHLPNILWDGLALTPANFVPEPTSPDRQLAASLYWLAQGVKHTVLADVFGISRESGCVFFNKVIRLIVAYFYDEYVKLSETDKQWEVEVRGFIENYGFPAVGAWDGFHIHVISQLKTNFSFKKSMR